VETSVATWITDKISAHRIAALFSESFAGGEVAVSLADAGPAGWRVSVHFCAVPDKSAVRALAATAGPGGKSPPKFERIAAKDWVAESLAGLKPVEAGRFVVHGAHDRAKVAVNRIGIEVEAALAFGTGHHGTTRGCLLALDGMSRRRHPRRILDVGTGTGVLAIAAARAMRRRVLATDIDGDAVRAARDNARRNHAGAVITVIQANGVVAPAVRGAGPFDLVIANILLGPLQRLALPLTKFVATGGCVVLSGLLTSHANAALVAYRDACPGLALVRRIELDGWTTLILKRGARRRSGVARRPRAT
jgi:ribosomal protein L11 methyltransferase